MNRSVKHGQRTGFTLIELLVVVAIIALLISILLPSLAAAREQAKRAACSANLKGIGFACLTYAEDAKGALPSYNQTTSGTVAKVGYSRGLSDAAVGNTDLGSNSRCYFRMVLSKATQYKIYLCPTAMGTVDHRFDRNDALRVGTDQPIYDFYGSPGDRKTEMDHFSYSFSNNVTATDTSGNREGVATRNTHDPRKAIVADRNPYCNDVIGTAGTGEGEYQYSADGTANDPGDTPVTEKIIQGNVPNPKYMETVMKANSRNHNKAGQNVAYLDGHAKWARTPRAGADDDFIWTPSYAIVNAGEPTMYDDVKPSAMTGAGLGSKKAPATALTDSFLVP